MNPQLTICTLTYNEEANIEACLDSLATVEAPVFRGGFLSKDRTLGNSGRAGHPPRTAPLSELRQPSATGPEPTSPEAGEWVLHLDAGERLTPGMARWINSSFDPDIREVDGYMFARRAIFLGRWIKHGGYHPIYHLRLYRRHLGHCENKVYDQHFIVNGTTAKASAGADLEDGVMSSLRDFTVSHARWAVFEAVESILAEEKKAK